MSMAAFIKMIPITIINRQNLQNNKFTFDIDCIFPLKKRSAFNLYQKNTNLYNYFVKKEKMFKE